MTSADGNTVISYLRMTLCAATRAGAPDEELLEQFVTQRDEAAFAALLRRHGPMVWGVCQRLLAHRQDAEDAFQATFLVLARKAAAIGRRQLLANWLFGVARRAALNMRAMRARCARHEQSCGDLPDVQATAETPWDDSHAVLDEELARMPAKYRLPLLLCGLEGMSHADAGKCLGWPTGTVAGRLSRGRELLRTRLLRRGVTAPAAALAAVLAPDAVSAAVPPQLVALSVRSAALVTASQSAAAVVSPAVAMVMHGVLRKMWLSRLLTTTALMALVALTLAGVGAIGLVTASTDTPLSAPLGPAQKQFRPPAPAPSLWPVPGQTFAAKDTPRMPAIRLPTDANAVVFRMDRCVDSGTGPKVVLTIYADGRVVAEVPDGLLSVAATDLTRHAQDRANAADPAPDPGSQKSKILDGRLSARELEEVLRFALHDQEFFEFDQARVKAAIRDQYQSDGDVYDSTDATTTSIRIQTADRSHEVRWSRLVKAAWDFPKVERLHQLYAVDRRLAQVFYVLLAGGPERVEAVVAKMNELVQFYYRHYPDAPQLTAADLCKVTPSADESQVQFIFSRNKDGKVRPPLFQVVIEVPQQGGEPTVRQVIPPGKWGRGGLVD
jgi:RNA polymerase sigma factor (sigma-70 family)